MKIKIAGTGKMGSAFAEGFQPFRLNEGCEGKRPWKQ
jgi:hypothetical protein